MIYRQRLTGLGWIGACAAVGGPVVFALAIAVWAEGLTNRYAVPRFPGLVTVLSGALAAAGWIMVLVGREYSPADPPVLPGSAPLSADRNRGRSLRPGDAAGGPFDDPVE